MKRHQEKDQEITNMKQQLLAKDNEIMKQQQLKDGLLDTVETLKRKCQENALLHQYMESEFKKRNLQLTVLNQTVETLQKKVDKDKN